MAMRGAFLFFMFLAFTAVAGLIAGDRPFSRLGALTFAGLGISAAVVILATGEIMPIVLALAAFVSAVLGSLLDPNDRRDSGTPSIDRHP